MRVTGTHVEPASHDIKLANGIPMPYALRLMDLHLDKVDRRLCSDQGQASPEKKQEWLMSLVATARLREMIVKCLYPLNLGDFVLFCARDWQIDAAGTRKNSITQNPDKNVIRATWTTGVVARERGYV